MKVFFKIAILFFSSMSMLGIGLGFLAPVSFWSPMPFIILGFFSAAIILGVLAFITYMNFVDEVEQARRKDRGY